MRTRWMSFIRSLVIIGLVAALAFSAMGIPMAVAKPLSDSTAKCRRGGLFRRQDILYQSRVGRRQHALCGIPG